MFSVAIALLSIWPKGVIAPVTDYGPVFNGMDLDSADFDGDGKTDVVAASDDGYGTQGSITIYRNTTTGWLPGQVLGASTEGLATGDLDADGDPDIAYATKDVVGWYRNDWPTFTNFVIGSGFSSYSTDVDVGDFDGDGDLDVLQGRESVPTLSPITLWRNDGGGVFTQLPTLSLQRCDGLAPADFDGDGDLDFAAVAGYYPDGTETAVFYNASLVFTKQTLITAHNCDWYITAADVDGDADADLIMPEFSWFRNDGAGAFTYIPADLHGNIVTTRFTGGAAAGDLDNDGDEDIVIQVGSTWFDDFTVPDRVYAYYNDGAGNFTRDLIDSTHVAAFSGVVLAQLNEDSCLDVVLNGHEEVAYYLNPGVGCAPLGTREGGGLSLSCPSVLRRGQALVLEVVGAGERVTASVADVSGRVVGVVRAVATGGRATVTYTPPRAGVFFARVSTGGVSRTVKFTVLP